MHTVQLIHGSTSVVQQIGLVVCVASFSSLLLLGRLSPALALRACVALPLATLTLESLAQSSGVRGILVTHWARLLRQISLLLLGVYYLAPFLSTLTSTIALDTASSTAAALLLLHIYLHDYTATAAPQPTSVRSSLSVTAAVFATVLFASKMPSPLHVFAHVLFALQAFLVFPFAQTALRGRGTVAISAHFAVTAVLCAAGAALLRPFSLVASMLFVALCGFVWLLAPLLFQRVQVLKTLINGPWDEARPPKQAVPGSGARG